MAGSDLRPPPLVPPDDAVVVVVPGDLRASFRGAVAGLVAGAVALVEGAAGALPEWGNMDDAGIVG